MVCAGVRERRIPGATFAPSAWTQLSSKSQSRKGPQAFPSYLTLRIGRVDGPELAARALEAGLVDELRLFLTPIVVGGGKRALPADVRLELELLDERRFASGVVYPRYRTRT
jgi:dihydrofolate reductase